MQDFVRKTLFVVAVVLGLLFIYVIRGIFLYLAVAVLLAYLMYSPVKWLRNRRVPRGLAILVVFVGVVVVVGGLIAVISPILYRETTDLARELPAALSRLETRVNAFIESTLPGSETRLYFQDAFVQVVENLKANLPTAIEKSFRFVSRTISGTVTFLLGLILIPLMCYYFLVDADKFKSAFKRLFPRHYNERIETTISLMNVMLGNYVRGQLTLSLIMGVLVTLGLTACGVKYALLLGVIAGIAELVPMVGPIIGFVPAALLALATSPVKLLLVVILYAGLHLLENNVLVPRIMGRQMDLHPLTVIIAMMVGAQVFGLIGLLLALPATAAGKIALNILVFRREEFAAAGVPGCGAAPAEPRD